MKIKILPNVSSYRYDGVSYKPGVVIDIRESNFVANFMEDLTPKPEEETPIVEETKEEEPIVTEEKPVIELEKTEEFGLLPPYPNSIKELSDEPLKEKPVTKKKKKETVPKSSVGLTETFTGTAP